MQVENFVNHPPNKLSNVAFKKKVIHRFRLPTDAATLTAFPPPLDKTLHNLQLVKNLPQKEFDFQRQFAFPNIFSHPTSHPTICQEPI